jgi:protein-tyrosine phosphatase
MGLFNHKIQHGSALLGGTTDIHCHILPGVDDGSNSLAESAEILRLEGEAGVKRAYLTPHMMGKEGAVVDPESYGSHHHHHRGEENSSAQNNQLATSKLQENSKGKIIPSSVIIEQEEENYKLSNTTGKFASEPLGGFSEEHIKERFEKFKKYCKGNIDIRLAAEYMMNPDFSNKIKDHNLLAYSDGKHILVETSYFFPPVEMDEILYNLTLNGYIPIIAHPERYNYMQKEDYKSLKQKGYAFQLNYLSLTGYYGETIYDKAIDLLDADYYNFTGSDFHRSSTFIHQIQYLKLNRKRTLKLQQLFANNDTL